MGFRATNFTVTLLLLVAFTIFIAGFRQRKSLDSNWPLIYWVLVLLFTISRPEESFDYRIIFVGLAAGALLRFEFMSDFFVKAFKIVELAVFAYIVLRGIQVAFFL